MVNTHLDSICITTSSEGFDPQSTCGAYATFTSNAALIESEQFLKTFDKLSSIALEHLENLNAVNASTIKKIQNSFSDFFQYLTGSISETLSKSLNGMGIPEDCISTSDCIDIKQSNIDSRSINAAQRIASRHKFWNIFGIDHIPAEWAEVQEFLRLRIDDPRDKMLFLTADYDHNGALHPGFTSDILSYFALKYDSKHAIVHSFDDICAQVKSATKTGKLAHVVINGHGNDQGIILSEEENTDRHWVSKGSALSCLDGVDPIGKITLLACSTAKAVPEGNIAQEIADQSKRLVLASNELYYPFSATIEDSENDIVFHPKSKILHYLACGILSRPDLFVGTFPFAFYNKLCPKIPYLDQNVFIPFRPRFKGCATVTSADLLHEKEKTANIVVENGLISKTLLAQLDQPQFPAASLCSEDPRKKFIVLTANHTSSSWFKADPLNPSYLSNPLTTLAENYDLKYAVISSKQEICMKVKKAKEAGPLAGIIIQGTTGKSHPALLLSKNDEINASNINELACLNAIERNRSVILLGGSIAQGSLYPNNSDTIPTRLSKIIQREVVAATCPIYSLSIKVTSKDPLLLDHPTYSFVSKYLNGCSETSRSLLQQHPV